MAVDILTRRTPKRVGGKGGTGQVVYKVSGRGSKVWCYWSGCRWVVLWFQGRMTWNSTYTAAKVVEQEAALHLVASVVDIRTEASLAHAQWDLIFQVQFVLKPFKVITAMLSAATATLGNVILIIGLLMKRGSECTQSHDLLPDVHTLVKRLEEQIKSQLEPLTHNLATICDHRFKGTIGRWWPYVQPTAGTR